jgi:hypothetical protein
MKKAAPQNHPQETPAADWRREIELERLRLERAAAEDRKTELVARLAIELGRARPGRPAKEGTRIVPDVDGALRLLAEAREARLRERTGEGKSNIEDLERTLEEFGERDGSGTASLFWHDAKRHAVPGSGGKVSAAILCDVSKPSDFFIHAGFFNGETWSGIAKWEVLRDEEKFRNIIAAALGILAKNHKAKTGRTLQVTPADIEKV